MRPTEGKACRYESFGEVSQKVLKWTFSRSGEIGNRSGRGYGQSDDGGRDQDDRWDNGRYAHNAFFLLLEL